MNVNNLKYYINYKITITLDNNRKIKGKLVYLEPKEESFSGNTELLINKNNKYISIPVTDIIYVEVN